MSWMQKSDYSSDDVQLDTYDSFVDFYGNLDVDSLDRQMEDLINEKEDWCPWGIGVWMDRPFGFHILRNDTRLKTFDLLVHQERRAKFMGFIPWTKRDQEYKEGLTQDMMLNGVKSLYAQQVDAGKADPISDKLGSCSRR